MQAEKNPLMKIASGVLRRCFLLSTDIKNDLTVKMRQSPAIKIKVVIAVLLAFRASALYAFIIVFSNEKVNRKNQNNGFFVIALIQKRRIRFLTDQTVGKAVFFTVFYQFSEIEEEE
jgi:hypothetical protein